MTDLPDEVDRRVVQPFYLLIDVSAGMAHHIREVTAALRALVDALYADPIIDDLVMLSVITFDHDARTVVRPWRRRVTSRCHTCSPAAAPTSVRRSRSTTGRSSRTVLS